ncbi:MAG TPA: glycosyltransferase family 4 protein [Candidatus Acidoferrum sp.]|nr:glycosyltransferase family 4 protein [Candidatus Acidoferrum sp.]
MKILQLLSCRGWSSDAYWAARATQELTRRGHTVTLGCRSGTEARVIDRARAMGVERIATFAFASGVHPVADAADVRRLSRWLVEADVVHVHRGKEHWLAAVASRLASRPAPLVRTRHITQAVRPHAANRWLYRRATALTVAVTEAIRRQYLAAGLVEAERVVTLAGGADAETYRPQAPAPEARARLGAVDGAPLVGLVSGLRVMKGHRLVVDAVAELAARGIRGHFAFVGQGSQERLLREAIARRGLTERFTLAGHVDDLPDVMSALDVALYVPVESEGMSRVVFEYLAAGRALIATRVGIVPEILTDGEHALLVPAGDAGALAAAIERALSDPALRARLGAAGRRLVLERYSGARVAAALERHYADLARA